MSKKGKFSVQNWQSDPMNSPKAFGELKTNIYLCKYLYYYYIVCAIANLPKKERRCDVYRTMVGSWLLFLYLLSDGSSLSLKPKPRPFKNF